VRREPGIFGAAVVSKHLYIVAPCTNRKHLPVPSDLRLRTIGKQDLRPGQRWCERLEQHHSARECAEELYAGDHWSVVRTLSATARAAGLEPELWIISAGYGLVSSRAPLRAYSATFSRGHPDSVGGGEERRTDDAVMQAWWAGLSEWSGPEPGAPRSVASLIQRDPSARMLIFGSPNYVRAVEKDLLAAMDGLDDPMRLVLVSGRDVEGGRLAAHVIASDISLQRILSGARVSLHARVARLLLECARECEWDVDQLRRMYQQIVRPAPEENVNQRKRMTDEEIRQFIVEELAKNPRATATSLLRSLRDSGRASEQDRFKLLFVKVRERRHGA
jgi:hypothetical protein